MQLNIIDKSDKAELNLNPVTFTKGLCWPIRSYIQVYVGIDALDLINVINKEFIKQVDELLKSSFQTLEKGELDLIAKEFVYNLDLNRDQKKIISSPKDELNIILSKKMYHFVHKLLCNSMPPNAITYYKTLKYAEDALKDKCITQFKPSGLLNLINNIHVVSESLPKNSYRTKPSFVLKYNLLGNENTKFEDVEKHIQSKCNKEEYALWNKSLRNKIKKRFFSKPIVQIHLTESDNKFLNKYLIGFTPAAHEIPELMKKFSEEFYERLKKCDDVKELMAWFHQSLVEIHPWDDSNGTVARIMMNIIGMQAGQQALLFDNDTNYSEAVDKLETKKFSTYLKDLENIQTDLYAFNQDCVKDFIKLYCSQNGLEIG